MPTPIGHSLFGTAVYLLSTGKPLNRQALPGIVACAALANLPDVDFAPVAALGFSAVKTYHQVYTHNLGFCLAAALVIATAAALWRKRPFIPLFALTFLLVYSHVVFDALGYDGNPPFGVQLFWPLTDAYFMSPVFLFVGAAKGSFRDLFSLWNFFAILIELAVLLPATIFLARHNCSNQGGAGTEPRE
jgi:membrane-bound metal-dependent hydrolase YbcI (DUF457 family)